ncbi:MAG TPA: AraC family transcriptional regulator [Clostridia bacterium]|nr:AraC family transcriptional regulator [Clostridia bacterium]
MSMKRGKQRRGKVFKAWLIYYSIILLLPIVLAVAVYNQAISIITNENISVRQASLHQIGIKIDAQLQQLRTIGTNILLNDKVSALCKIEGKLDAGGYYSTYQASKDINKYLLINNNNLIQDVYVYFNHSGYMLSGTKTIDKDDVATVMVGLGFAKDKWQDYLKTNQSNNYHIIDTPEGQKLFYIQSLSFNNKNQVPLLTIIIVTKTVKITGLLNEIPLPPDGTVMLLGENNNALNINPNLSSSIYSDLISYENGHPRTQDHLVVVDMDSSISGCKYIMALPYVYYLQKAEYIKTIVVIYLAVCLSLGFVLAYYFSRRNYLPLQKLKTALETEDIANNGTAMDEFSFFELKINNLISKKEQLQRKLTDNKEITRNNILFSMLKGKQSVVYQKESSFPDYDLFFKSDNFSVILFEIENGGEKLFKDNDEEAVFPIVTILIRDVFQKVTGDNYNAYFIECDGQIAGIVNYSQNVADEVLEITQYEMEQVTGAVIYHIKEHFDVSLSAALSNLHRGLKSIREAYREASDVFEYKHLKSEIIPVMRYGENGFPPHSELKLSSFLVPERQFYDLVVNGNYKGAYNILKSIIGNCAGMDITSLHMVKFRMFGLVNMMLNVLGEIKTDSNIKFFEKMDPINRLMNANTLAELQEETLCILDSIVQFFEKQDSSIKDKMEAVTGYINRQYYRTDLCVQLLSEKFGMSVSYLSRMYKKATGDGLLDYIHRVRVEKAKVLLAGGMSIKDVAEKVGYYNSQALIRAFKRMEGITPGQYKMD